VDSTLPSLRSLAAIAFRTPHTEPLWSGTTSHPIDEDLVRLDFLPASRTEPIDEALLTATELTTATHAGTHVEAPRHRFPDGDGIGALPPHRFLGEGLVWEPGVGWVGFDSPTPEKPADCRARTTASSTPSTPSFSATTCCPPGS
jgi:hypothetical protein